MRGHWRYTSGKDIESSGTDKGVFLIHTTIEVEMVIHSAGGRKEGGGGGTWPENDNLNAIYSYVRVGLSLAEGSSPSCSTNCHWSG